MWIFLVLKKAPTNISIISVEDARSHTNTTMKHTCTLMMSLCAKKAQESVVTNICIWGIRNTSNKQSTQINIPITPRSKRRHSQTLVVPPNSLFLHHLNSPFVLHTQTPNPFGYTCTVLKIHSTSFAIIMNTTMEN